MRISSEISRLKKTPSLLARINTRRIIIRSIPLWIFISIHYHQDRWKDSIDKTTKYPHRVSIDLKSFHNFRKTEANWISYFFFLYTYTKYLQIFTKFSRDASTLQFTWKPRRCVRSIHLFSCHGDCLNTTNQSIA